MIVGLHSNQSEKILQSKSGVVHANPNGEQPDQGIRLNWRNDLGVLNENSTNW